MRLRGPGGPHLAGLFCLLLGACQGQIDLPPGTSASSGGQPGGGPPAAGGSAGNAIGGGKSSGGSGNATSSGGTGGSSMGTGGSSAGGGSAGMTASCTSTESPGAPVPMRRLTATQVARTVEDIFAVTLVPDVRDERLLAYRSNISTSVDTSSARNYFEFAGEVVATADLSRCETSCLDWLLDDTGRRLFRRPLSAEERERYTALYDTAAEDGTPEEAAGWVLEAMLQSPTFLYLDESVKADGTLDDYAVASRLSLLLWGKNPDAELLDRAERGELASATAIQEEATRMLNDPASEAGLREFVDQWLDLGRLDDADTRPDLADLGPSTVNALRDEPVQYFRRLLREGAGLGDLLTSSRTVVTSELEELYGDDLLERSDEDFTLDPAHRGGILSLPGVAAALAHARRTSPTLRGKAVLAGLLCTPPDPPPANVDTTLPEVEEGVGTRERLEIHMTAPACRGCHMEMDGIGFALEKLDWLGRYREEENEAPIDDSSTFPLGADEVTVTGAAELGATLAASPNVAACVSKQWLRYSLGITETRAVDCLVADLAETVSGSAGLERMIVKSLTSDWFRRGPGEAP